MPRMFDILREEAESPNIEPQEQTYKKSPKAPVRLPQLIRNLFNIQKKSGEDILQTSQKFIDTLKKKDIDNNEITKKMYNETLKFVEVLLEKVNKEEPLNLYTDEIYKTVDTLTNQLILGDSLLEIVAQEYDLDDYLPKYTTNVCILSLAIGLQMNFNKSKLHTLGIAAILKDVGMLSVKEIVKQPRALMQDEYNKIRAHASISAEIVSRIGENYNTIKEIIEQHHERMDGKGYPLGLKANEINDYAKIVGLVDTYEAMTHSRPFRETKMPHQVIREIMYSLKPLFRPEIIKALVDKISIYPIGSFVKLNNGDIAKVISSNSNSPLRPVVLVLLDSYGNHISESKIFDLSQGNSIYIKEPILLEDKN